MPDSHRSPTLKYLLLAAGMAALLGMGGCTYEFFVDSSLGGMPRKMVEADLTQGDHKALVGYYRGFAASHGFDVADEGMSGGPQTFALLLSRWNAQIWIHSEVTRPDSMPAENRLHVSVWVMFKGWLWWTDYQDADAFAAELARETRAVDPRAKITIHTLERNGSEHP